jgi:hypothetical protein
MIRTSASHPYPSRPGPLFFRVFVIVSIAAVTATEVRAQYQLPAPSASGRYIAFTSAATNLVAGDTNGSWDVFVRDHQTDAVVRVSVMSDGTERIGDSGRTQLVADTIDISDDGRFVVFASHAPLVANDTNRCAGSVSNGDCEDIYVHDRATGETSRVSVASDGTQGDAASSGPSLSPDGRFVAFVSSATTLVPDDRNAQPDIFLHDRVTHTTTRVSASSTGVEQYEPSIQASAANDGIVAFITKARLSDEPDSLPCRGTSKCSRAYVYVPGAGPKRVLLDGTLGIAVPSRVFPDNSPQIVLIDIDGSGRWVVAHGILQESIMSRLHVSVLYDRLTQRTVMFAGGGGPSAPYVAISGNGRVVTAYVQSSAVLFDTVTGLLSRPPDCCLSYPLRPSADGLTIVSTGGLYTRDADGDSMADEWETAVGLDPITAADAAIDTDGDTLSNLEEFQAGSHPKGTTRRYLAEGAANAFFTTRLALFNPANTPTGVVLRFLGAAGAQTSYTTTLGPLKRETLTLESLSHVPSNDFSTVIESVTPIVVERTMTWDVSGYGAHAETALEAPATAWYLAEGATHGPFDLFYLLQNPNAEEANVTITYLRPAPRTPVVKTYTVDARSRRTIWVDDEGPALAAEDLAARIEADRPILVERAMYASTPAQPFAAGHAGVGIAAPALQWFFAEGATGPLFDLYMLVGNPGTADADVRVSYLRSEGEPIVKTYTVAAAARLTVGVNGEDPRLTDTVVSMLVESLNGVPIVAERAMWWPRGQWYEAHLSAGATATGTMWGLADVIVSDSTETYILIANTGTTKGTARVRFADAIHGVVDVALPAQSRVTVRPAAMSGLGHGSFGTIIESDVPTVVERTSYTTVNGIMWAAGTSVLATRLR